MAGNRPIHVRLAGTPYATEITNGQHRLIADEPPALGGADAGPEATELLLASLGACTAITLRMYADRKGWPLDAVDVDLDYLHRDKESTRIRCDIRLHGDLDDEQRARLMQIAKICPVHRVLTGEVTIEHGLG